MGEEAAAIQSLRSWLEDIGRQRKVHNTSYGPVSRFDSTSKNMPNARKSAHIVVALHTHIETSLKESVHVLRAICRGEQTAREGTFDDLAVLFCLIRRSCSNSEPLVSISVCVLRMLT
jgi:hypothetical protein